ncbi:SDR family oxidoreductase [Anaerophaga thermohalophila]|uniref:SDR family oxidoreductase n=1 Tax=Anaerophaga thermohalophila TaxID=177400 RepID=UPI000237BEE2|nr:SDR family oxidoreductase [Anaerophaga thermohalophila]MDI3521108.1 3-oxoacyl-[acyl-carrier protein] reductase [Anaerophaga sp.]
MDIQIKNLKYLVTGASSGLGQAVAKHLLKEGAEVIITARNKSALAEIKNQWPEKVSIIPGDITDESFLNELKEALPEDIYGAFLNAGGPPASTISETTMDSWDNAYRLVMRWKIELSKFILQLFEKNKRGRFLFSESASVNSPIPNLVLSNSFRMAVVGYVKTMTKEITSNDITANIIAPGYHETPALDRIFRKMAEQETVSIKEAKQRLQSHVPVGRLGNPEEFASLAAWLLSPLAGFASGQVFTLDGGEGR